jgi:hypothetical protein
MSEMGQLAFGMLRDAWKGEASDFTPQLDTQVDSIGRAIGVELASLGSVEVATEDGRQAQGNSG